jgi:hypothetical protein
MYEPQMLTVWKITGEESSDSSAGSATCYAITGGDTQIPKPQALLNHYSHAHDWYVIHAIERVGVIPAAFWEEHADTPEPLLKAILSYAHEGERVLPEGARDEQKLEDV